MELRDPNYTQNQEKAAIDFKRKQCKIQKQQYKSFPWFYINWISLVPNASWYTFYINRN